MSDASDMGSLVTPEILYYSANASARFCLSCLEPTGSTLLRARSSFVDPAGQAMHWHDFGDLEGPGWAANAVGGAHLLYRWGGYAARRDMQADALCLVDHVLDDGFVRGDGFLWPYWDLRRERFCLNYAHGDDWLCPGSLAAVGVQMLDLADTLGEGPRARRLRRAAAALAAWSADHVRLLPSDWIPRRITLQGDPYPCTPEGGPDPIHDHSADGLFLIELWARLGWHGLALRAGDAFLAAGGMWGSINHDTYDDHENVAYAVAFGVLRRVAALLGRPGWHAFAYDVALPAMARYRLASDPHGVHTRGLFWMEASWDTAYLWENAEIAQAHLEAWSERGEPRDRDVALGALSAMAHHHYGSLGFLSEGIDWNNHVGQRHHVARDYYGAIRYTEPLLNNLHLLGPTLTYLHAVGYVPSMTDSAEQSVSAVLALSTADRHAGLDGPGVRYLLSLSRADPAGEGMERAIALLDPVGIDGLWLRAGAAHVDAQLGDRVAQLRDRDLGVQLELVGSDAWAERGGNGIAEALGRIAAVGADVLWVDDVAIEAMLPADERDAHGEPRPALATRVASTVRALCPGQRVGWAGTIDADTEPLLRALAGEARPLVAIDVAHAARQASFLGRDVELIVRCASMTPADYALAVLAGAGTVCLEGLDLTRASTAGGDLARWRTMLAQLAAARLGKVRVGVGIAPAPGAPGKVAVWEAALAWVGAPLGNPYGTPHLLLGEAVHGMERYGIGSALQAGAVVTPGALQALLERGWGARIGVAGLELVQGVTQFLSEEPLNGVNRGRRLPAFSHDGASCAYAINLLPEDRGCVLSWWVGPDGERPGAATVALELDSGGRVLALPYELDGADLRGEPLRHARTAWAAWLGWVGGALLPVWAALPEPVAGAGPVSVCTWVDPGDGSALVAAANPAAEPVVVGLSLPGLVGAAERLGSDGVWVAAGRPAQLTLPAHGFAALRWPTGAAAVRAL